MFLLSGDAIVNESMLTGESVPVSKIPVKDEDLLNWKENQPENPKTYMYGGTRVIRIRGALSSDGGLGRPALAMVARTGEPHACYPMIESITITEASTLQRAH